MRKLVLVLMMYGLIYGSAGAQCEPEVMIGKFMGIPAFSNEPNTESGSGCYQCVHLVKRFSERYHGGFGRVECGANMWNVLPRDYSYLAIANNSSTAPPQVGDLIIWWQDNWDCVTRFGHVGIVCWVTDSEVGVFEQNIDKTIHLEVQILRDRYGHVINFGLRDCSQQRKSQKIQEEAPPAILKDKPDLPSTILIVLGLRL